MSLVVLSSGQNRFDDDNNFKSYEAIRNRGGGISQPESFQNSLTSPLKIPPNSEVAVVSVKINRDSVIDIPQGIAFSWYIGDPLVDGNEFKCLERRTSTPFECYISPGTYTFNSFPDAVQASLREYIHHPDYFNLATCTLEANGQGYVIESKTAGDHNAADVVADMIEWTNSNPSSLDANHTITLAIAQVDLRRDKASADKIAQFGVRGWRDCSVIGEDHPLSAVRGHAEFDLTRGAGVTRTFAQFNAGTEVVGFMCGLTRPTNWYPRRPQDEIGGLANLAPPYGRRGPYEWWDYAVRGFIDQTTSLFTYEIGHTVTRTRANGQRTMEYEPITYWGTGIAGLPTAQLDENGAGIAAFPPGDTIDSFIFTMTGESIKIEVQPTTGPALVLVDPELTMVVPANIGIYKVNTPKPVGDTCRSLYPKMALRKQNDKIALTVWGGIDPVPAYEYPQPPDPATNTPATAGDSWWGRLITSPSRNELIEKGSKVDILRRCYRYDVTFPGVIAATAQSLYLLCDVGNEAPDYSNVMILQPSAVDKDQRDPHVYVAKTGDISQIMGFPGLTYIQQNNQGPSTMGITSNLAGGAGADPATGAPAYLADARSWWWASSSSFPKFHTKSLFIKCPTLTHQSYNGSTGSMSKILAQIPRFDNSGNDFGSLYFQMNDRVYLKLNNPKELVLQDIQIDLCGRNEQIASDLAGSTEVVLHIR
jgi:hypothetical protein